MLRCDEVIIARSDEPGDAASSRMTATEIRCSQNTKLA